jgi:hypothetical protein
VFLLTVVLLAVVQWLGWRKDQLRRRRMLNFAPSGRTDLSTSRRDSEESYFNRLHDNIKQII